MAAFTGGAYIQPSENNIHTCSLYENVVNGTKVAWYKSSNIHPFIQNWVRVRVWSVATTFMQEEMQCMGFDFDVNAYLPLYANCS